MLYKKILAANQQILHEKSDNAAYTSKMNLQYEEIRKFKTPILTKIKSFILCLYLLVCYTLMLFGKTRNHADKHSLNLVFSLTREQIYVNGQIKSLAEFFNSSRFKINRNNEIWVEFRSVGNYMRYRNVQVTFDIMLKFYMHSFTFSTRIKTLLSIYRNLFTFILYIRNFNLSLLVAKEFIFDQAVLPHIDQSVIDKVITTQSNLWYLPLIFEQNTLLGRRFMLWYSSNSIPIEYKKADATRFETPNEVFQNLNIDEHWVWGRDHYNYFSKSLKLNANIKGSMVFCKPHNKTLAKKHIDVLIFDVTPHFDYKINKNSIYTYEESKVFISEILEGVASSNKKFNRTYKVSLKPKRMYYQNHDRRYIKFLKDLESDGKLNILNHNQNLYDLVNSARVIIGFPYVSPVLIGRENGIPSFFYLNSKLIKSSSKIFSNYFIRSPKLLNSLLDKYLGGEK